MDQAASRQVSEQAFGGHCQSLPRVPTGPLTYSLAITPTRGTPSLASGDEMERALMLQSGQCGQLGSPMYERLFWDLAEDYRSGGRTYAILAGRSERPVHDAIPLRLAGALHKVVLEGKNDRLARHYPSIGGKPGRDFTADFIGSMNHHLDDVETGLNSQVQTNEVGRSVVHLVLSHWMTTLGVTEYDHLEIGASAGLNLNFERFYACRGRLRMGDPGSELRFMGEWFDNAPGVPLTGAQVVNRRGTDVSPIDITDPDQQLRLLSFVWPDQRHRFTRTRTAIEIARNHPPMVDDQSAETWLQSRLARTERATVVFHSIVWQYLGQSRQNSVKQTIQRHGTDASPDAPLVWARMEPAGPVADVQVDVWDGTSDEPVHHRLAEIGYHGQNMHWL